MASGTCPACCPSRQFELVLQSDSRIRFRFRSRRNPRENLTGKHLAVSRERRRPSRAARSRGRNRRACLLASAGLVTRSKDVANKYKYFHLLLSTKSLCMQSEWRLPDAALLHTFFLRSPKTRCLAARCLSADRQGLSVHACAGNCLLTVSVATAPTPAATPAPTSKYPAYPENSELSKGHERAKGQKRQE